MTKEHKHKWFQTTLASNMPNSISYACNCGQWKIENFGSNSEWKIKDIKFATPTTNEHSEPNAN